FERFAEKIAEEFAGQVKYVITINEPNVYAFYSEMNGGVNVPPEQAIWRRLISMLWLIRAHKKAYAAFKRHNPNVWVSCAVQMAHNAPKKQNFLSKTAVFFADYFGNYFFYDRCREQLDFVGF